MENKDNDEVEEPSLSMVDVLEEEQELEQDATAVLGSGDDSYCTYEKGYMKRQPLYACLTCCQVDSGCSAGICLACSYHCHEGHELVELYTKRNFRCDCGNSKFDARPCKLFKDKETLNVKNKYNHNFKGKYCTCARPYPDPEDDTPDEMIQCCVCEDWFHGRHIGSTVADEVSYEEMVCVSCVSDNEFLQHYGHLTVSAKESLDDSKDSIVDIEQIKLDNDSTDMAVKLEDSSSTGKLYTGTNGECCIRDLHSSKTKEALFFISGWREKLCRCSRCYNTYKQLGTVWLLDPEDTVRFYEEQGKRKQSSNTEKEIDALLSLDRYTRTEMLHEYNEMSTSLREYLKKFAESKKVVRDEDIREFFEQMKANKKRKPTGSQYFCR